MTSRRVQAVEIHAEYAYYLGIIDYQQEYNFIKKVYCFISTTRLIILLCRLKILSKLTFQVNPLMSYLV